MRRVSHLIRELDRLARERGWTSARLASELGCDRTLLIHVRAGRKPLTLALLAQIAQTFGGNRLIRDLLFLHLAVEIPEEQATEQPAPTLSAMGLPDALGRAVQAYVVRFPLAHVTGKSLLLAGAPAILARAVAVLRAALTDRGIGASVLTAATRSIRTQELAHLRRVPLLVVERAEFASAVVADLLRDRSMHGLPIVLTTAGSAALPAPLAGLTRVLHVVTAATV